ncbi:hypothetical protein ETD86_33370 [Nonomuraea turkmeniaca]|uniref:ASCH domain-containing protein n=1 Tax=Nonomuraea turkmeniaca TaxID=103838 RepID=A0A5S4F7D6_9ACTN|nr:hypothetical protein [Nonomuraea turkmeniaca]TMR12200.1 hypothetical protein ETD86_33370 [Nonomuraea turkmeniaca]
MLFERRLREGVRDGTITLAFRRWKRAQVTAGGRYRMGYGLLAEVTSVSIVEDCTDEEARAAGYPDRAALMADLSGRGPGPIHRLELRLADTPDPRDVLAAADELTPSDVAALTALLARMGPWAVRTLRLIAERPGVRAGDLAPEVGQDPARFKLNVRKLKALGLTISLETGYRLSPRGQAYLTAIA